MQWVIANFGSADYAVSLSQDAPAWSRFVTRKNFYIYIYVLFHIFDDRGTTHYPSGTKSQAIYRPPVAVVTAKSVETSPVEAAKRRCRSLLPSVSDSRNHPPYVYTWFAHLSPFSLWTLFAIGLAMTL